MRTVLRLIAVLALVAGVVGFLANRRHDPAVHPADCVATESVGTLTADTPDRGEARDGEEWGAPPCDVEEPGAGSGLRPSLVDSLDAARVCPDAGYLCAGFEERGMWRVVRWDETTPMIRVRVPLPPLDDRGLARALQAAAARGIQTWHGHPFPLRIDLSDRPGDHEVTIRWTGTLGGRELGHARTRWRRAGEAVTVQVDDFALAVRSPVDPTRALSPRQIELTAAHEMGHALGLPHSDRPTDVMYPSNTATRLTSRDFRTMEALYRLGNGAAIVGPTP